MQLRTVGWVGAGLMTAGAAALAYASLVERNLFTLRRFDVPVLAPDAEPLRILHLSDLHLMPGQRRKQSWVSALAGTDPDLVVVTGDNIAHPDSVPAVAAAYGPLLDLPGAFVFGSNDYAGPIWRNPLSYLLRREETPYVQGDPLPYEDLRALLTEAGWVDLNNNRTVLKAGGRTVELAGVDDPHVARDDYPSLSGAALDGADVHVGVTHSPEPYVLDQMAADGFTLLLAGHTHGGQVRVPGVGALVTNCGLDRRMARGLHRWPTSRLAAEAARGAGGSVYGPLTPAGGIAGGRVVGDVWLHVSAGLGTHPTAPIRFACRPEASLLTLIPR